MLCPSSILRTLLKCSTQRTRCPQRSIGSLSDIANIRKHESVVEVKDFRLSDNSAEHSEWGKEIVFTCEHASNEVPRPFFWPAEDEWVRDMHWAYDPGAYDFTQECAQQLGSSYVSAKFSRLLCDANRPIASDTLFRDLADGKEIILNKDISEDDIEWRLWKYYLPYHLTAGRVCDLVDPSLIISVHSFNGEYEGNQRHFDLGILCTHDDMMARLLADSFKRNGFNAEVNAPWSGKEGFMYSADSLAVAAPQRRKAMMLELRNDLATDSAWRKEVISVLVDALGTFRKVGAWGGTQTNA